MKNLLGLTPGSKKEKSKEEPFQKYKPLGEEDIVLMDIQTAIREIPNYNIENPLYNFKER